MGRTVFVIRDVVQDHGGSHVRASESKVGDEEVVGAYGDGVSVECEGVWAFRVIAQGAVVASKREQWLPGFPGQLEQ